MQDTYSVKAIEPVADGVFWSREGEVVRFILRKGVDHVEVSQ